ncbi:hypothetical protein EV182_002147, partial [Spiromyces aspiralis]
NLQRPLKTEIVSTKRITTAQSLDLLNSFLSNEAGAQSAPSGVIQQLVGLQKALANSLVQSGSNTNKSVSYSSDEN